MQERHRSSGPHGQGEQRGCEHHSRHGGVDGVAECHLHSSEHQVEHGGRHDQQLCRARKGSGASGLGGSSGRLRRHWRGIVINLNGFFVRGDVRCRGNHLRSYVGQGRVSDRVSDLVDRWTRRGRGGAGGLD